MPKTSRLMSSCPSRVTKAHLMIPANLLHPGTPRKDEVFEDILKRPGLRIERIVSRGHTTPVDEPYGTNGCW